MNELIKLVKQWSIDRGLDKAEPKKQLLKLYEEYGELCAGIAKDNTDLIKDSIGDMIVVMTILCQQLGLDMEQVVAGDHDLLEDYWVERDTVEVALYCSNILDNFQKHEGGSYKTQDLIDLLFILRLIAIRYDSTVKECLELAYDEIKGRTGKMVNGVFVKSQDLKE